MLSSNSKAGRYSSGQNESRARPDVYPVERNSVLCGQAVKSFRFSCTKFETRFQFFILSANERFFIVVTTITII
jgi:hypothetical protein